MIICFIDTVQSDLLFHDTWVLTHFINECIFWSSTKHIDYWDGDTLIETTTVQGIKPYGLLQNLVMDGEISFKIDNSLSWLNHRETSRISHALAQHVQIVE